jgi:hypothetical protein
VFASSTNTRCRCTAEGVILSESSDSGILNVEASILTDIMSFLV